MQIKAPAPEMTDYEKVQFSTEVAFNALVKQARDMGLSVAPVMGLMYLPTEKLTSDFQQACKAILIALANQPQEKL